MTILDHLRVYFGFVGSMYLLTLVFYPFELVAPAEKGQPLSHRLFNLAYVPLAIAGSLFAIQPLVGLVAGPMLALVGGGLLPVLVGPDSGWAAHSAFALFFALVSDLWQYWVHRLQHTVPILWQTHRFHHGETALNATTHLRVHLLSTTLLAVTYLPVLALLGAQTPHFVVVFAMFRLWGLVNHANVRLHLGVLTPVISGPQWHRIHHSILPQHRDRNFASYFPFIDKIFGTYYGPHRQEYPPSGLAGDQASGYLHEATIAPLEGWRKAWAERVRSPWKTG